MSHNKFSEDILVLTERGAWHGLEDFVLPRGTTTEEGFEVGRLDEIVWEAKPLYVEVVPGVFQPFGDKKAMVRMPHFKANDFHVITSRTIRDYQVVNNNFLMELAQDLADATGWTFEGCGTVCHNEKSFVQLRLNKDFEVAGRPYEKHKTRFFYGDDKASGSGWGGLVYTRVECDNTWRAAVNEDGILKVPHRDDPHARWEFINAQAIAAIEGYEQQNEMLNKFFCTSMGKRLFQEFVETTFPKPTVKRAMVEGQKAEELIRTGQANGYDFAKIFQRAEKATHDYNNEVALIGRRREATNAAFEQHNARFKESANTFYAAFQGLTYPINHGDSSLYRGDALANIIFGGQRGQDINKGYSVLVDMLD